MLTVKMTLHSEKILNMAPKGIAWDKVIDDIFKNRILNSRRKDIVADQITEERKKKE